MARSHRNIDNVWNKKNRLVVAWEVEQKREFGKFRIFDADHTTHITFDCFRYFALCSEYLC